MSNAPLKINAPRNDHFILILFITIPVILILLYIISYFSAPMTDESLPVAIALRFLQGQRPFVDDLSPYIGLGLLIAPLVKLSLILHDGKNELILFLRHSYLVFSSCIGIYTYLSTKKYLPVFIAYFIGISITIFHPFGINNFHYNTLALLLWTAIVFQLYNFIFYKQDKISGYAIFSVLNLLLCFSYPTFGFYLALLYTGCFFFLTEKKKFYLSHFFVISISSLLMVWLIFSYYGVHRANIADAFHFNAQLYNFSAHHYSMLQKFGVVVIHLVKNYLLYSALSLTLILTAYCLRKSRPLATLFLCTVLITPLFFINILHADFSKNFYFLDGIGFTGAMVFLFFLRNDTLSKRLFYSVWLPSFGAGLLTSVSSYNLEMNLIIGFFPAIIVSFIFYNLTLQKINPQNLILSRGLILSAILILCYFQANYIYGDEKRGLQIYTTHQQYQIEGPFNGLYVDPKWIPILTSLQKDIHAIDTNDNTFIYFGPFAAGYLFVNKLKPGDYLAYCSYEADHYGQNIRTPNYTIDLSRTLDLPKDGIKIYLSRNKYSKITSKPSYDIYYTGEKMALLKDSPLLPTLAKQRL